ncbi:hypothetical protein GCM10009122_37610 [Fulvivirga kasyanovii]|uniref:Uncharacterized protein n=1 Tax=Fulvivirga kasyanovii TaxID=396812 RepID=A0ABW9RK65_9BACT|nr:hypothetical protein [Fulvivirga kasyanovii]MTI23793.1 hypothetical protein [Fulvivirga kasyanovii]
MENGTYQHYTVINNTKLKNSGTWKLMETQEEILFENFSFLTDENPPGNWFSRLRLEEEEIQLIYACDINAYYKRIGGLDSLDINHR